MSNKNWNKRCNAKTSRSWYSKQSKEYQSEGFMMPGDLSLGIMWTERFAGYKKSGLSIRAWCAKNGFKPAKFH